MHASAGELPDEPAVYGTETQAALSCEIPGVFYVLKDPFDFGAAEVGVDQKAGLVPYLFREAEGL